VRIFFADSGAVVLVENEGNARLSSARRFTWRFPELTRLERRIWRILKLLGRSATGQPLSVASFLAAKRGTRRAGGVLSGAAR
jgi:L-lactate utilization protein LutB